MISNGELVYPLLCQTSVTKLAITSSYASTVDEISPEKKRYFSSGAITYVLGVVQTVRLKQSFDNVINAAKDTASTRGLEGGVEAAKAKAKSFGGLIFGGAGVLKVLNGIPSHITKLLSSGNNMVEYAKKFDVNIGEQVTEEFSSVLGFDEKKKGNEKKSPFARFKSAVTKKSEG